MQPLSLIVMMHGERIGELLRAGNGRLRLLYDDDVVADPDATPLSASLPIAGRRHQGQRVDRWISGLLPDRQEVLVQWRRDYGVRDLDAFSLLWHVGEDVAGAAQFVRPDRLTDVQQVTMTPLTIADVSERLRRLRLNRASWTPTSGDGQFSLAGAQAKIALAYDGGSWAAPSGRAATTHILKPAIPDLPDQDINELLCLRTAAALRLTTARSDLMDFEGERAVVVERYDRTRTPDGVERIHQEDSCQALGLSPTRKYESQGGPGVIALVALIRRVVHAESSERDVERFVDAVGFSWLTAGTDAHARNYALLLSGPNVRLAPLYDLNSWLTYATNDDYNLAMRIGTETIPSRIGRSQWSDFAVASGVDPQRLISRLENLAERLPAAARSAVDASPRLARLSDFGERFVELITQNADRCLAQMTRR